MRDKEGVPVPLLMVSGDRHTFLRFDEPATFLIRFLLLRLNEPATSLIRSSFCAETSEDIFGDIFVATAFTSRAPSRSRHKAGSASYLRPMGCWAYSPARNRLI